MEILRVIEDGTDRRHTLQLGGPNDKKMSTLRNYCVSMCFVHMFYYHHLENGSRPLHF